MIKIATVVGARPQFTKLVVVSRVIRSDVHTTVDVMILPMRTGLVVCDQEFVTRTIAEVLVPANR